MGVVVVEFVVIVCFECVVGFVFVVFVLLGGMCLLGLVLFLYCLFGGSCEV